MCRYRSGFDSRQNKIESIQMTRACFKEGEDRSSKIDKVNVYVERKRERGIPKMGWKMIWLTGTSLRKCHPSPQLPLKLILRIFFTYTSQLHTTFYHIQQKLYCRSSSFGISSYMHCLYLS